MLLLGLFLVAVSPTFGAMAPNGKEKVTLKLWGGSWGVPRKDDPSPWARSTRAVFEQFQKDHPEIEIVSSSGLQIGGSAAESSFLLAMAGGTAPDVFYVNFRKLHTYIEQNFLYPLDEFIKKDPQTLERVHPKIRDVITVDGHVYCLPWFQCAMALYYRKDLFRDAGLDPNRPPKNWDEFYEYARKLTIPEKGQWGFYFPQTSGAWYLTDFIWQAGGEVIRKGKDGKYRAVFNSPEAAKALEFYRKLTRDPWTREDGKKFRGVATVTNNQGQEIRQGKIAMWLSYSYEMVTNTSDLNPSLLGIAPLPAGPTGIRANEINAGMWGMSTQIRDPKVRQAAWEYIKYMASDEADAIRTRSYVENGMWKYVNPVKLKQHGYTEYISEIPKAWLETNEQAFKYGRPEPNGPNCEMIYLMMDPAMQAMFQNPESDARAILGAAVRRINIKMLGNTPPAQMARQRTLAWVIVAGMLLLISTVTTRQIRQVARAHAADTADTRIAARRGISTQLTAWLFMLPAVLSILVWAYYPLLRGMVMAFQDFKILGGSSFVGLDNFIKVLGTDTFRTAILNSFLYVGLALAMGFFVPIFLALALSEVPRGKMLYRTLYYLPAVTSGIVIMFLWKWFYDPSPQGLFNTLMSFLHIEPQLWLNDSKLAMLCIIIPGVWAGAGPGSIIYLAALKSIPEDMYEAADVDGASMWTKIRHIVFPMLSPLIIINFVGATIGAFKAMENVFVMTGGGPNYATHVMGLDIWINAFMYLKFGFATAEAWIMGSMLIGFTMYQLRILKDLRFSAAGDGQ